MAPSSPFPCDGGASFVACLLVYVLCNSYTRESEEHPMLNRLKTVVLSGVVTLIMCAAALLASGGVIAHAGAVPHILPPGCQPTGNVPCTFAEPLAGQPEITVGPTTSGSGEKAVLAVQSPNEVYLDDVDIMQEAQPGQSKAWIAIRHHDAKDKYVLLLKNRAQLQFIVELHGVNHTLASVPYVVALNEDMDVELDARGFTFTAYDLRGGGRVELFSVTDTVGMIPAGNGDSIALYANQGTQACWDELAGTPHP